MTVAFGARGGIRDMVAVSDGLLLLVGPDNVEVNQSADRMILHRDDAKVDTATVHPTQLAVLQCGKAKPPNRRVSVKYGWEWTMDAIDPPLVEGWFNLETL